VLVLKRSEVAEPSVDVVLVVSLESNGDQVALAAKIAGEAVLGSVERTRLNGR
jgi:hypothetical protein